MKIRYHSQWKFLFIAGILLIFFATTTVLAQDSTDNPVAVMQVDDSSISWISQMKYEGLLLSVSGPGEFYWQKLFQVGEDPSFNAKLVGSTLPDGQFTYEILVLPTLDYKTRDEKSYIAENSISQAQVQTGAFSVLDGKFIGGTLSETDNNDQDGNPTTLDQTILDDLIVDGSACFGFDCVTGESFGFDTIRLKENNLRIHFQDTSNSGSFPSRDWRIVINDSANGGANYFAVQDADASRNVFVIEGGAPANSLYVEDYGRVGLGTSTPVVELHIKDSDTPTVRLEQDGSGGWTPQTWDVAANESNFFIRDVTNGSKLSFRIQPGTPSNTLSLKSNGYVGVGTWSPESTFHVDAGGDANVAKFSGTGNSTVIISSTGSNSVPKITFADDARQYQLRIAGNVSDQFVIRDETAGANRIVLDTSGNVGIGTQTMTPGALLTVNGTISELSDVNTKENFSVVNGKEVLASLVEVPINTWSYKEDETATIHMGPTAQDFSKAFGLGSSDTSISLVDRDGVALAAIQGLNEIIKERDAQISDLEARLDALEANDTPQAQFSFMLVLPWLLLTLALAVLAFTFGKRHSQKLQA